MPTEEYHPATFAPSDPEVEVEGSELWFNCPHCDSRLCAKWFHGERSECRACGASVDVKIEVGTPDETGRDVLERREAA